MRASLAPLLLSCFAFVVSGAPTAQAYWILVDDTRYVSVGSDRIDAAYAAPFVEFLEDSLHYGSAGQNSEFSNEGFIAVGAANANALNGSGPVDAHSVFDVTFRVSEAGWFWLDGSVSTLIG